MDLELHGRRQQGVSLEEALERLGRHIGDQGGIALVYTWDSCRLAKLEAGRLHYDPHLPAPDPATVFEARVFSPRGELRWLAADKRSGTAVLLSEEPLEEFVGGEGDDCSLRCIERLERQYLLWGSVSSSESDGWSKLAEGRLAPFRVPGSYSSGHVVLKVREYLGVDEYGNAAVVEELFEGLTQKGGEIA